VQKSKIRSHRQYVELIIEGAKAGSFEPNVLEESMRDYLNKDIESIIAHRRRTDENLEAYALIFQDKEKFVGFVIISDMPPPITWPQTLWLLPDPVLSRPRSRQTIAAKGY
jgi:hypothetical protein